MALKFAFVMDPLESVIPDKDTTFVFMLESLARGHQIFHLGLRGLFTHGHQAFAWARRCEVMRATPHYRFLDEGAQYPLEAFDAIFMRKDPPADAVYLFATMLLSLADSRRTFVLNNPSGLREANEKLYALNFPGAIPPTIVQSGETPVAAVSRRSPCPARREIGFPKNECNAPECRVRYL